MSSVKMKIKFFFWPSQISIFEKAWELGDGNHKNFQYIKYFVHNLHLIKGLIQFQTKNKILKNKSFFSSFQCQKMPRSPLYLQLTLLIIFLQSTSSLQPSLNFKKSWKYVQILAPNFYSLALKLPSLVHKKADSQL